MISILPAKTRKAFPKKPAFGKFIEPPHNFTVVRDNFLYRGGALSKELENIEPAKQFKFLLSKKIKSILCFLNPKKYGYLIEEELNLIEEHNKNNPYDKIKLDFLPCWESKKEFNAQRKEIKTEFAQKIYTLPKPIYMHCLAGIHLSEDMEFIFKEAVQEGKIEL